MRRWSLLLLVAAACGDDGAGLEPVFAESWATTYTEVRNCRSSGDHDLNRVRVLADADALAPYRDRTAPFPPGAVVLKAEYDFADTSCTGPVVGWTAMQKRGSPEQLGWIWQRVRPDRTVETEDDPRCAQCHTDCGRPPDGYDGTCTVP